VYRQNKKGEFILIKNCTHNEDCDPLNSLIRNNGDKLSIKFRVSSEDIRTIIHFGQHSVKQTAVNLETKTFKL